jgi:hypothetical protein
MVDDSSAVILCASPQCHQPVLHPGDAVVRAAKVTLAPSFGEPPSALPGERELFHNRCFRSSAGWREVERFVL